MNQPSSRQDICVSECGDEVVGSVVLGLVDSGVGIISGTVVYDSVVDSVDDSEISGEESESVVTGYEIVVDSVVSEYVVDSVISREYCGLMVTGYGDVVDSVISKESTGLVVAGDSGVGASVGINNSMGSRPRPTLMAFKRGYLDIATIDVHG